MGCTSSREGSATVHPYQNTILSSENNNNTTTGHDKPSSENELPKGLGPSCQNEEIVECAKPNEIMGSNNSKRKTGSQRDGNSDAKNKTESEGSPTAPDQGLQSDAPNSSISASSNQQSNFLQSNTELSSSQVNFFKMLDEKIENGADLEEEDENESRRNQLEKCMKEWETILSRANTEAATKSKTSHAKKKASNEDRGFKSQTSLSRSSSGSSKKRKASYNHPHNNKMSQDDSSRASNPSSIRGKFSHVSNRSAVGVTTTSKTQPKSKAVSATTSAGDPCKNSDHSKIAKEKGGGRAKGDASSSTWVKKSEKAIGSTEDPRDTISDTPPSRFSGSGMGKRQEPKSDSNLNGRPNSATARTRKKFTDPTHLNPK